MPPSQAARIIGAGRGIGKQIALELARRHYRLAIAYNEPPSNVEETVAAAVPRMPQPD